MTVGELIAALQALPQEAQRKPVQMMISGPYDDVPVEVETVDYNLSVVTLK